MDDWDRFNDQFRETFGETQDRWRAIKAKRKAAGKCWQCAKLIADCNCQIDVTSDTAKTEGKQDQQVKSK